jgi:DNA-binding NtrC family response regulator
MTSSSSSLRIPIPLHPPSESTVETTQLASLARPAATLILEIQDNRNVRRIPITTTTPIVVGSKRRQSAAAAEPNIVVSDRTVSARHCMLALHEGGIRVTDLGSRNGTYVGGARIHEAWGSEGMTILLGQTTIVCCANTCPSNEDEGGAHGEDPALGHPLPGIAGGSRAMSRVAMQVRRLARLSAPVLIAGETGVGKELVARALHAEGYRTSGPFVALNVAALPRELVESELFGHERGAFTGATSRRFGAFAEAEGGTLFLDEIGELPIEAQPKLLRALDGYEVRRIGSVGSGRRADVRVVAATHVPLLDRVARGLFRRDLYHRLEVFVVELPPLRERPGDVLPIAKALLEQMSEEIGKRELTPAAVAELAGHDWPGNVRELRNVLYRAADFAKADRWIDTGAIVRAVRRSPLGNLTFNSAGSAVVVSLTPEKAREWLAAHNGNISAASRAANIPRTTFRKLLARAGISVDTDE